MIVVEPRDSSVVVTIQGGAVTEADQDIPQEYLQPQVRPATQKKVPFDIQNHKKVFLEA